MHLENAPLVHVLAQVVFSEVPDLSDRVDELYRGLHGLGYLRRADGVIHEIQVAPDQAPMVRTRPRWEFLDRDWTWSVILSERFVVMGTSRYFSSEQFWERFTTVLGTLRDTVGVQLIERLGLRFIDVVRPAAGESFSEYVSDAILGFPLERVESIRTIQGIRTEKIAATDLGQMIVRSTLLAPGANPAADVVTELRHHVRGDASLPALAVDFDHFRAITEPEDFDPVVIVQQMEQLRIPLRDAFRALMTVKAEEVWGPWVNEPQEATR